MVVLNTKEIRKSKGLSISKVSYKSKVARSYLTELESGKYVNPGLQVVCRLCKSLKTTPNDLINKDLWNWEEN
ncbi:helix-turn-helix domain-containing protein [Clostridium ihumii]|uniref:helix-turn-helix domain-containing protein n=1 Tax=Clostridium ihumii TaxID=1470356 RepID=UPI00054F3100|nr:helix-turn-helix transcriptional regulator [Clostridium ihumii]